MSGVSAQDRPGGVIASRVKPDRIPDAQMHNLVDKKIDIIGWQAAMAASKF
jgi:hypothetical protein